MRLCNNYFINVLHFQLKPIKSYLYGICVECVKQMDQRDPFNQTK